MCCVCLCLAGVWFQRHGALGWQKLAAIFLCLTGCEAMFADMGHFSRSAVKVGVSVGTGHEARCIDLATRLAMCGQAHVCP